MQVLISQLTGSPILSLHHGHPVALAGSPIINPSNLEVVAIYCQAPGWFLGRKNNRVILTRDIREIAGEGIIIDSLEDIEDASEIVRLKDIIEQNFNPIGMSVATESGQTLGKIEDCTFNIKDLRIQKLYVKQSLIKNMLLNNLVIDRAQIIDITPNRIIVRDTIIKEKKPLLAPQPVEG